MVGAWLTWDWLAQNALSDLIFWVVPTVAAIVFSRKTLKRLVALWRRHTIAQEAQAAQLARLNDRLAATPPTTPEEE